MENELLDGFFLHDVRIEPLTGSVTRDNETLHLASRSIEVLLCLCRHPRHLVTRDELLDGVWGGERASAEALNHAIGELRHALGDRPATPRFVQTVPKRGYRLLAVPRVDGSARSTPSDSNHTPDGVWASLLRHGVVQAVVAYAIVGWAMIQIAGETFDNLGLPPWAVPFVVFAVVGGFPVVVLLSWFLEVTDGRMERDDGQSRGGLWEGLGRNYLAVVAAYGIAAVGAGIYQATVGFASPDEQTIATVSVQPQPDIDALMPVRANSIAVLRFVNLDGSDRTGVFASGLSEDILDRVARVPGLLVSARGDSWSLPDNATSTDVRRRLRVAYYLEGSVRIENEDLTVVAQLIDSETGFHMQSRSLRLELTQFNEIQNEVTGLIAATLRAALPEDLQRQSELSGSEANVDAYVAFRRGKDVMDQPRSLSSIELATAHFNDALRIDPDYAVAHAGLCGATLARFRIAKDADDIGRAERSCAAALAAGPRLGIVHRASGNLYFRSGRLDKAILAYSEAIAIDPKDADAVLGLSRVYRRQQRSDEAEELINRAIDLQPGNWRAYNTLGSLQFSLGRFADATESYRRVTYLDPENFVALGNLATASMMAGDFEGARDRFAASLEIEETPQALSNLGLLHYYLGDLEASVQMHRRSVAAVPNSERAWMDLGDALSSSGQQAEATKAFSRGAELARERVAADPENPIYLTYLAWAEAMTGNKEGGRELAARAVQLAPDDPYSYYYSALVALVRDERGEALVALQNAVELGYPRAMLAAEPLLVSLRSHPTFQQLIEP